MDCNEPVSSNMTDTEHLSSTNVLLALIRGELGPHLVSEAKGNSNSVMVCAVLFQ